ncbi:YsnF/AvaK domain-containing protein [Paenibacillus gansuensis]|uniref:YsnF/AvaK domain-containing protein n=1 Tax=Paenibacillus gansuensis TaxID=306542 RepID=A0ABW5PBI0_9BACL
MNNHIVGVFKTEQAAISAIEELKQLGYRSDDISVISRNKEDMNTISTETGTKAPEGIAAGAATGGVVGGLTGLLAGIGLLAIPGVGPILAAGPIAATLTGAAVGAGAGSLVGGLVGLGIPEDEAERYNNYVDDEHILVMVDDDNNRGSRVYDIFRAHGSINSDMYGSDQARMNTYGTSDTELLDRNKAAYNNTGKSYTDRDQGHITLHEERLEVDKEKVQTGEVRLHKEVIEERQTVDVPVKREEVVIERNPVSGRDADTASFTEGETIRIPVSEERVEVTKKPVVTEEVTLGKRTVEDTKHVSETLRKEKADLDRSGNAIVEGEEVLSGRNRR